MIDSNTRDLLEKLRIEELAEIVDRQENIPDFLGMPFEQRLSFAVSDLYAEKAGQRNRMLAQRAKLSHPNATFPRIDYLPGRNLDRSLLAQLSACNFLGHGTNIAFFGPTGCGKTFLACCLGNAACARGARTRFYRMPDLFADFECLESSVTRRKFVRKLAAYDLLILDEWLCDDSYPEQRMNLIFEIVEKRSDLKPTVFCSQYDPSDWYRVLGASAKSESIVNRIFATLCRVDCGNFNMREALASRNTIY